MEVSSVLVGPRALGSEARAGLSGEDPAQGRAALALFAGFVAVAFGLACGLGMAAYRVQSARVATLVAVLGAMGLTLASAPLVPELLRIMTKRSAPPESVRGNGVALFARVVCAVGFAAVQDGIVTATSTIKAHVPVGASLGAGLESAALVALPLLVLFAPAAFVLSRPGSAILGHHMAEGLSARRREGAATAVVLYAALTAVGAVVCWQVALRFSETHSTPLAVIVGAASAAAWTLAAAFVVASVAPIVASLSRPLASLPLPAWLPARDLVLAAVGIAALHVILPSTHAVTPGAAVVGFAVGPLVAAQVPDVRRIGRADVLTVIGVSALLTGIALGAFARLPDLVRTAVIGRAPYASLVAALASHPSEKVDEPGRHSTPYTPPAQVAARDPNAAPMRDNVILIHIEALRPDHVGFIGYKRPTTPNLDRFRQTATWFKNAYSSAPTTRFALSMMFTGHEIERIPQSRGHAVDFTLLPGADTLAERLEPLGYDRVGYTLSYVMQHIKGLGQGFRIWQTPWDVNDWERAYQNSAEQTTNAALEYLKTTPADGSKPYFLFLHYMSNHDPYIKHDKWDYGNEELDKYDSALNYEDDQLGRLFAALDARADKDRTAIILYSDHGELFGEHGYKRHGFTLYQPDIHVVLLARVPGAHAVDTIETPMLLSDVTPTLVELMGLPVDKECQSWDLLPYLRGAPMPPRALYLYSDQWRTGVHYVSRGVLEPDGRTKLIHNVSAKTEELYDIASDPEEQNNLATAKPDTVEELVARVNGWDDFENKDHTSFETSNRENATKQAHISRPVYPQ